VAGWLAWRRAPGPAAPCRRDGRPTWRPCARPAFRRLLAVFMLNGIASAVPATLVLFFIQDRLQAGPAWSRPSWPATSCARPLSIPLWLQLVARIGLARSWLAGMVLAMSAFVGPRSWARRHGCLPGGVRAVSVALGTDLALPGALLAGVIAQARRPRAAPRAPTSAGGTSPPSSTWRWPPAWRCRCWAGSAMRRAHATRRAAGPDVAYCLLPCVLKLGAALALYFTIIRRGTPT
jgi:GPH family glycoside/pentoside/hexuronide:cation symporter